MGKQSLIFGGSHNFTGLTRFELNNSMTPKQLLANQKNAVLATAAWKQKRSDIYSANPSYCNQCQIILPQGKRHNKFCSNSCSAKFNNSKRPPRSDESKQKTSATMKSLIKSGSILKPVPPLNYQYPYTKLYGTYHCHFCNKSFWQKAEGQKCCSIECRDSIRSQNKCKKTHIKYFNKFSNTEVDLQSTWELTIAKWLDSNNIEWFRPNKRIKWINSEGKNKTYLPDFYLPKYESYLDVKNPIKMIQDSEKIDKIKQIINIHVGDIIQIKSSVERLAGLEPA